MKSFSVTIQMKAAEQHFPEVVFIVRHFDDFQSWTWTYWQQKNYHSSQILHLHLISGTAGVGG